MPAPVITKTRRASRNTAATRSSSASVGAALAAVTAMTGRFPMRAGAAQPRRGFPLKGDACVAPGMGYTGAGAAGAQCDVAPREGRALRRLCEDDQSGEGARLQQVPAA